MLQKQIALRRAWCALPQAVCSAALSPSAAPLTVAAAPAHLARPGLLGLSCKGSGLAPDLLCLDSGRPCTTLCSQTCTTTAQLQRLRSRTP